MESSAEAPFVRLQCSAQQYAWGKRGSSSAVAQLKGESIQETQPYAELWMGTHPNGPSRAVLSEGNAVPLAEWLHSHSKLLGSALLAYSPTSAQTGKLPFLFKVLSINSALSIQAHPDTNLGAILHTRDPKNYPDPNDKPEMAIALTPFEALCGFRPISELRDLLSNPQVAPELYTLLGEQVVHTFLGHRKNDTGAAVKALFGHLLRSDPSRVADGLNKLTTRQPKSDRDTLVERLSTQYPGDVGCFVSYLLNHLVLPSGTSFFMGPNEPHAYLSGDCIECMTASDNTVRAGLTPKFRDIDVLVEMLTYRCGQPDYVKPNADGIYAPPHPAFKVQRILLPNGTKNIGDTKSASLGLVTRGSGTIHFNGAHRMGLSKGHVLFLGAVSGITIESNAELEMWIASLNCVEIEYKTS